MKPSISQLIKFNKVSDYHFLTAGEKKKIIKLNEEGYNNVSIASLIGCTTNTVRIYLQNQGIKSSALVGNPRRITAQHTPRIVELYRQDVPLKAIAAELAIPYHIVVNAIYNYRCSHDDLPYRHSARYTR